LKDGEPPHPTNYRGCSYAKEELQRRKNQRISNQGPSGKTFFSKYTTPERTFASALRSSVESTQLSENQKESAGPQKKQVADKASVQAMQEEIVNSNFNGRHVRCLHYGVADYDRALKCCVRRGKSFNYH
jgi:hypothetical protein